ncbi:hypothetical protein [Ekhidna sp. To15]|uniref:hypothetical protein n=1 Tax=Ekhidna sp. To15 TaxID=3395267 RepID=UPI003F51CD91
MSEKRNVEDILAELGKKIDHLMAETKKAGNKVTDDMEKQIEKLKAQKDKLEEDLKDKTSDSSEKWGQAREHMNDAAAALNKAIGVFFKS